MSESKRLENPSAVEALGHLEEALRILDDMDASAEIAGHVDLAICRLRDDLENAGHILEPRQG